MPLSFICFYFIFNYMYMCISKCGYVHMSAGPVEDRRGHWISGSGITGSCERSDMDDGVILGPLKKQFAGLTAEPTLQLLIG